MRIEAAPKPDCAERNGPQSNALRPQTAGKDLSVSFPARGYGLRQRTHCVRTFAGREVFSPMTGSLGSVAAQPTLKMCHWHIFFTLRRARRELYEVLDKLERAVKHLLCGMKIIRRPGAAAHPGARRRCPAGCRAGPGAGSPTLPWPCHGKICRCCAGCTGNSG